MVDARYSVLVVVSEPRNTTYSVSTSLFYIVYNVKKEFRCQLLIS